MSTPTITLSQLHSDLLRIYAHPLSSTNITNIQHTAGGAVFFETDMGELEAELAEAKASEARLEKELLDAQEEATRLDSENDKLTEMHEAFADKESGITPATYREQADAAAKSRDLYKQAMSEARDERDALRKRKGVTVNLFACERDILRMVHALISSPIEKLPALRPDAEALLAKLNAT
jgi:hypothetical protein